MQCNKCNSENLDTNQFCHQCGAKLTATAQHGKKKWLFVGAVALVILIAATSIWLLMNNSVSSFKNAIENNKYAEANKIYDKEIKGDSEKESEINSFLETSIEENTQNFINEKIDYTTASNKLSTIEKTNILKTEVLNAQKHLDKINHSKVAFKTGNEFLLNNQIEEAMSELKNVNKLDVTNYTKAQDTIKQISSQYKQAVMEKSQKLADSEKYDEAAKLIKDALSLIDNDSDLIAKETFYTKKHDEKVAAELKLKIQKLKQNQEVSIVKTSTFTDWLDDHYISITIKNNSDKVIKSYTVGWMGYDKNGYPVKTGWLSPDFVRTATTDSNVQPGKTNGSDFGWQLTGGLSKSLDAATFIACVKAVEYYDGSTWENEYYNYWIEEFKEKPLNK